MNELSLGAFIYDRISSAWFRVAAVRGDCYTVVNQSTRELVVIRHHSNDIWELVREPVLLQINQYKK